MAAAGRAPGPPAAAAPLYPGGRTVLVVRMVTGLNNGIGTLQVIVREHPVGIFSIRCVIQRWIRGVPVINVAVVNEVVNIVGYRFLGGHDVFRVWSERFGLGHRVE